MERPKIKKNKKRLGKGHGTGQGKQAGKGHKGTKARSGGTVPAMFEGGQMPIYRRLPKRGFKNMFRVEYRIINLDRLVDVEESVLDIEKMEDLGLVTCSGKFAELPVKVLANGANEFHKAITIKANAFSKAAVELIEKNGGKAEVI